MRGFISRLEKRCVIGRHACGPILWSDLPCVGMDESPPAARTQLPFKVGRWKGRCLRKRRRVGRRAFLTHGTDVLIDSPRPIALRCQLACFEFCSLHRRPNGSQPQLNSSGLSLRRLSCSLSARLAKRSMTWSEDSRIRVVRLSGCIVSASRSSQHGWP